MKPRPNVIVSAIFLRGAICSRQIIGIGKIIMIKSMLRLIILVATTESLLDPQTPGRRGSQFLANGRQIRNAMNMFPIPKAIGKAIAAYEVYRKGLFAPNMAM